VEVPGYGRPGGGVKRALDVTLASTGLLLLSPVAAVIALAVLMGLGRPVLFRQVRPGLDGRPFMIIKFRTMRPAAAGRELKDDGARITRLGRFLRSSSLDELPELVNVLRGDMSVVGPRPLLVEYLSRYSPEQSLRHLVKPGVTGLAQVSGRNSLTWEAKFRLDGAYVSSCSLWLDLRIIVRTVTQVLRRNGVDADGQVGAPEFLGST
jgi:sugar transferase EpsL